MIVAEGLIRFVSSSLARSLQWGRNLIVAEGATRPFSTAKARCFNGAAT